MKRRHALVLGGVALGAGAAGIALFQWLQPESDALRGATFEDLGGRPHRLSDWPARLLALNFWATWCAPCREEIPLLMQAREKHGARGFEVVGVAIDLAANVAAYMKTLPISYPVVLAERSGMELMRRLGNPLGALPFTALVAADGRVVGRKLGAFSPGELERLLAQMLD